jgi:hypothetical protein
MHLFTDLAPTKTLRTVADQSLIHVLVPAKRIRRVYAQPLCTAATHAIRHADGIGYFSPGHIVTAHLRKARFHLPSPFDDPKWRHDGRKPEPLPAPLAALPVNAQLLAAREIGCAVIPHLNQDRV